jgi:hypothetical protein
LILRLLKNPVLTTWIRQLPKGKRGRERPRKAWEDAIEELGREKRKTMTEMDKLAKDRKGFSRWTEDPDTGR